MSFSDMKYKAAKTVNDYKAQIFTMKLCAGSFLLD